MERSPKKMKEQEKKKAKFLNKMLSTLQKFYGSSDEVYDDVLSDQDSSFMSDDICSESLLISFWLWYYEDTITFFS